jgi:purine-binding chemotaxis protein CheW
MSDENQKQDINTDISDRYLCFNLGTEEFAIPLLAVREVIGVPEITRVPQAPNYFLGITNLRGQIISVLDLRQKLGIKSTNTSETTVIICDFGTFCLGSVVDSVNKVLSPEEKDLGPKPTMTESKANTHIMGVINQDDKIILRLDIAKALDAQDIVIAKEQQKNVA